MDSFFGIGLFELVMIAIIALVVLGPERLPGAMRDVGKYARQLRDVSNEFQSQFSEELKMLDEINPRKVISSALDPNSSPPAKPPAAAAAAQAAKPAAAAKPLAATKPAAAAAPAPVVNGETANSILPPTPAAVEPAPASAPAATDETANSIPPPPAAVQPAPASAPAATDETANSTLLPPPAAVEPGTAAEVSPPPEPVTDPDAGAEEPR